MIETLKSLLTESKQELLEISNSPDLDAEVLICHALKIEKKDLILLANENLSAKKINRIRGLIRRRKSGEPVAYIIKIKEFYNLDFLVSPAVLIPRPESEWLVEHAASILQDRHHSAEIEINLKNKLEKSRLTRRFGRKIDKKFDCVSILDMGTGSGCLIISLIKKLSDSQFSALSSQFYASDISPSALSIARRNAKSLLDNAQCTNHNVHFIHSDLFSSRLLHKKFDLIVANLPYVPIDRRKNKEDRIRDGIECEPRSAIFADDNGAAIIKKFLDQAPKYLAENGTILIELDPRNAKEIQNYANSVFACHCEERSDAAIHHDRSPHYVRDDKKIELKKDLAGLDRYLIIN